MKQEQKTGRMTWKKGLRAFRFHFFAILFGIIMIYPLVWMFASSLKPNDEVFTTVTNLIPSRIVWENYVEGWQSTGRYTYSTYFSNSLLTQNAQPFTAGSCLPQVGFFSRELRKQRRIIRT